MNIVCNFSAKFQIKLDFSILLLKMHSQQEENQGMNYNNNEENDLLESLHKTHLFNQRELVISRGIYKAWDML